MVYIPLVDNSSVGNYTLTVNYSSSCSVTRYVNLIARPQPTIDIVPSTNPICTDQNLPFIAFSFSGANNYYWSGSQALLQNPQIALTPTVSTLYTVIGEDGYGCKNSTQLTVEVGECTGFHEQNTSVLDFEVYPNPASGDFEIRSSLTIGRIQIVNAVGQLVNTVDLTREQPFNYRASDFPAGVYSIVYGDGIHSVTKKLLILK